MTLAEAARRINSGSRVPRLLLVSDEARLPDPLPAIARLPAGAGVLLRHYGAAGRRDLARQVARLARCRRLVLLVAGDWRLAAAVGADGLHLPEGQARHGVLAPALGWLRRGNKLLTVAAHSRAALGRARKLGAHGALLSPVFATASHPGAACIGPVRFGLWRRGACVPVVALGGVNGATARRLAGAGPAGVAGVGALK
jgi:thiamine-phosphate pyrophosphorylase